MAKAKFERSKPHVNIGTIGHVDHGKTTLTAAITKTLALAGQRCRSSWHMTRSTRRPKRRSAALPSTPAHVEYQTDKPVTTRMSTARATPTMLKT